MKRIDRWCEGIVAVTAVGVGLLSWGLPLGDKIICRIIVWYPGCL